MELNADFDKRAWVHSEKMEWVASPMPGVKRRMLDRLGDEVARATSIVSYAKGSQFSPHVHTGGEEFLVLEGVFQDEHGDYPAGTYVRNPPNSSHTPGAKEGCVIFVKLWQFDPSDQVQMRQDIHALPYENVEGQIAIKRASLFDSAKEKVSMEKWSANATFSLESREGLELLVVSGGFTALDEAFEKGAWLRLPCHDRIEIEIGDKETLIWVKTGHLAEQPQPPLMGA